MKVAGIFLFFLSSINLNKYTEKEKQTLRTFSGILKNQMKKLTLVFTTDELRSVYGTREKTMKYKLLKFENEVFTIEADGKVQELQIVDGRLLNKSKHKEGEPPFYMRKLSAEEAKVREEKIAALHRPPAITESGSKRISFFVNVATDEVFDKCIKEQKDLLTITDESRSRTLLHSLARGGKYERVKKMIRAGADVNTVDKNGESPLYSLCESFRPDLKMIKMLVENGADINQKTKRCRTAIMTVCGREKPNIELFDYLISKGADIHVVDTFKDNILTKYCDRGKDLTFIKRLFDLGAQKRSAALAIAVKKKWLEGIDFYLENGVKSKVTNEKWLQALPKEYSDKLRTVDLEKELIQGMRNFAKALEYSPDGKYLVVGGRFVEIYNSSSRERTSAFLKVGGDVTAMDFSKSGEVIAIEYLKSNKKVGEPLIRKIKLFTFPEWKVISEFDSLQGRLREDRKIALNMGKGLLATSNEKQLAVFDIKSGNIVWEYRLEKADAIKYADASFDVTPDWKFFLFNLQRISYPEKNVSRKIKHSEEGWASHRANVISPDGKLAVANGGTNGSVYKLYDIETGNVLKEADANGSEALIANPSFSKIYSYGGVWDLEAGTIIKGNWEQGDGSLGEKAIALSLDEKCFSTSRYDIILKEGSSRYSSKQRIKEVDLHPTVYFDSEGKLEFPQFMSQAFKSFNLETRKWSRGITEKTKFSTYVDAVNPSGTLGFRDNKLYYPLSSNKKPVKFEKSGKCVFIDDETLALFHHEELAVYDVTGKQLKEVAIHARFSVGGRSVRGAIGHNKKWLVLHDRGYRNWTGELITIYDANNLKVVFQKELPENGGRIRFSQDASLATLTSGKNVEIYNTDEWTIMKNLYSDYGNVRTVSFSPCNTKVLLLTITGVHPIIDIETDQIVEAAFTHKKKRVVIDNKRYMMP